MAHELNMREPKKVIDKLEGAIEIIKKMKGTIETTSEISKMDLAIGGVDKAFATLTQLNPHLDDSIAIFNQVKEKIEEHVATFEKMNEDFEY